MNIYEVHCASLNALQVEQGDDCPTFQWNSGIYRTLPGGGTTRKALGAGGFSMDSDLRLVCSVDQFGGRIPKLREQVLYGGRLYRIDSVNTFPGGQTVRFECNDAAQAV